LEFSGCKEITINPRACQRADPCRRQGWPRPFFAARSIPALSSLVATATRAPRHSSFVVVWFFLRPRRWCFVGTAFWAVRHCFVLPQHHPLSSRLFLRSRDIGDSSPRPQARDCFVLPRPFLGHATSSFVVAVFFAAARHWGFFAAFWGRATLFRGPFLWYDRRRGFFCGRETLGFRRCGLLGQRGIVCAAGHVPGSIHNFFGFEE